MFVILCISPSEKTVLWQSPNSVPCLKALTLDDVIIKESKEKPTKVELGLDKKNAFLQNAYGNNIKLNFTLLEKNNLF